LVAAAQPLNGPRRAASDGLFTNGCDRPSLPSCSADRRLTAMAAKDKNKTKATAADPIAFIDKVKSDVKRSDSHELVAIMKAVTGEPPKMWGPTIVGFGTVHYKYESGREGDICLMGFSPRAGGLVLYIGPTLEDAKLMSKLGRHKTGKGCLYINKLDDVDRGVLRKIVERSVALTRKQHPSRSAKTR
jgi:hypothetical protein